MDIFNPEWIPWLWIIGGIIIMISEFIVPGMFIVFIGFGVTLTGVVSLVVPMDISEKLLLLAISSIIGILVGSVFIKKFFHSEVTRESIRKDEFRNEIVPVIEDILVNQKGGRIRYHGTEWDAISETTRIPKGERVRIIRRDSISFFVEPLE